MAPTLFAQPPPQEATIFRTGVSEILVDLVVRDKKGRPIRGLSQKDVTILEDGVPQEIVGFRELEGGTLTTQDTVPSATNTSTTPRLRLDRQVRLVSLVFERLGPDGRRFAKQAALDFIDKDLGRNVYYSVFYVDRGFTVLQQYTYDRDLLRRAIEHATGTNPRDFASDLGDIARVGGNLGTNAAAANTAAAPGPGNSQVNGSSLSDAAAAAMVRNMAEFATNLIREDMGRATIFSLWAIIDQLAKLPGRKSVLHFSEGIEMPNSAVAQFRGMMSAANRANVSFYTIDARGLTTSSDQANANVRLRAATRQTARATQTENVNAMEDFRAPDIALDSIHANQQVVLQELAESTGGQLLANTNDFRPFLRKLSEEFNSYYEVVYRPRRPEYDGRFRQIAVKVNRADTLVQARNGYFALPLMPGQTVFPYEVPLLNALGRDPLPSQLEYRTAVLDYEQTRAGRQQALLAFDLPMSRIQFTRDSANPNLYRVHTSFVALIKDATGQVIDKLSREIATNQPADKVEQFKQGRMIFTRPVTLAPGRYTLESAVSDQEANLASARRTAVVISEVNANRPALSAITLVRRIDKPLDNPEPHDPLQLPAARIIPTLADVVPRQVPQFAVFFLLYPDPEITNLEKPQLIVELLRDGKAVQRTKAELPTPDKNGNYPCLVDFPGGVPGKYEVKATVKHGDASGHRSLFLTIE